MKEIRQKGFVLIVVVVLVVSAAGELLVLVGLGKTMLFQTQAAHLEAVERNLAASGLAWAKHNVRKQRREGSDKAIELDVTNMNARKSTLTVTMRIPRDKGASVQINTSCSRGKYTVRRSKDFHIKL
jgi:Tfp pilus assembly protein PilX